MTAQIRPRFSTVKGPPHFSGEGFEGRFGSIHCPIVLEGNPRDFHPQGGGNSYCGRITESITWITPLLAMISVLTTFALSTLTPWSETLRLTC